MFFRLFMKKKLFVKLVGIIFCLVIPFKTEAAKCISGLEIKDCKTVFGNKSILKTEVKNSRRRAAKKSH